MYKGSALQDLDADIVRSVLLTAQFKKQQELNTEKSNPDIKEKKPDEGLNLISQQLHPYLRELLRSYIYNVPLKGDIPNPTKKTGEACPFAERCVDRMDECTKTFPVVTTKPRSWVRCLKFEKTQ
jgi:oligopeptide/dipeptide ABC transporter ATP-binding protein